MKKIFWYFIIILSFVPTFASAEGEVLPWQTTTPAVPTEANKAPEGAAGSTITTPAAAVAPIKPEEQQAQKPKVERPSKLLASISFAPGDQVLSQQAGVQIDGVVAEMKNNKDMRIEIDCYASGGEDTAIGEARIVSLRRGIAARKYMIEKGIEKSRINIRALGEPAVEDTKEKDRIDLMTY